MAYVLKTEIITENGVELKKTYYTSDGKSIIGISTENVSEKENELEEEPTETELIQAEILLNQAEIIAKQNEHDEVLAELLLGQQEVAKNV